MVPLLLAFAEGWVALQAPLGPFVSLWAPLGPPPVTAVTVIKAVVAV